MASVEALKKVLCQFCGDLLAHVGAPKMHEVWCKNKSQGQTAKLENNFDDSKSICSSNVSDLVKKACQSEISESGDVYCQRNAWMDTETSCEWVKGTLESCTYSSRPRILVDI